MLRVRSKIKSARSLLLMAIALVVLLTARRSASSLLPELRPLLYAGRLRWGAHD